MASKSGSRKKSDSGRSGDAGYKDRLIAELKDRNAFLENELRLKHDPDSPDTAGRKRVEDAMRDSEEKFRSVFDNAAIGIVIADPDRCYLAVNDVFCVITGYSREKLLTMGCAQLVHPDDQAADIEEIRRLQRGEASSFTRDMRYVHAGGSIVWVRVHVSLMRRREGPQILAVVMDITDRKRAEDALRKNEKFLNNVFNCIQDGVSVLSKDLSIIRYNPTIEMWHGKDLAGKKCYRVFHGRDEPCARCPSIRAIRKKTMQREIVRDLIGWKELYAYPLVNDDGEVTGTIQQVRDITERMQAEEAVRFANAYNRSLIEASLDPLVTISPDGKITDVNMATEVVTGISRDKLVGTDFSDYFTDPGMARKGYKKAFEEDSVKDYPLEIRHRDGHITPVLYNATVYRNESGEVIGVFAAARDITGRKRAEEALQKSEKRYRGIVEDQSELICLSDTRRTITFVNDAYCRYFGKKREDLVGHEFLPLIAGEDREAVKASISGLSEKNPVDAIEHRVALPDGSIAWLEWKNRIVFNEHGQPAGYQSVGRDITRRKQAELAFKEGEKKYRSLVEHVNDWVWEIDTNGTYSYASPRVRWLLGYEPDDMIGTSPFDYMAPEELGRVKSLFVPIFRAREEFSLLENTLIKNDGSMVTVETSGVPIFDAHGTFIGYRGIDRDITERKQAEEIVRLAGAYNRSLIEASLDPLVTISPDGVITDVNKATEAVTGYPRNDLVNTDFSDYFTEPEKAKEGYLAAFKLGSITDYTLEIRHKDGHVTPVIYNASVYRDESGKVIGVIAAARDITGRTRAEEALKKSEANLDRAQRIASLGNWEWDLKTDLLSGSREYYRMFGHEGQEAIPFKKFAGMLHPDDRKWVDDAIKDIRHDNLPHSYEFRLLLPDGRERYVHSVVEVIYDNDGRPVKVFGTMQDITERKRVENALQDAKDQVELYVDLMGHDINNMNQVSMGFLELAHNIIEMEGKLGEDNIVLLDKATDSLKSSSQLIDNVRKLRREKMGMYEPQVLDVGIIIGDAIEHFDRIPGRDIKITYGQDKHYLVKANSLLKDVFINLIGNAVKHSRGSLAINIRASPAIDNGKEYCRVDVEDDGPGIPDMLKATLFDRLNLTATRAKGKGFGLCLIKMLVDDYRGKFSVEDRVKGDHTKGARFVVMLPSVEK